MISWLHFGDLHISGQEEQNYDFVQLIDEANRCLTGGIAFALLGPNENGRHWPSRRQRAAVAQ